MMTIKKMIMLIAWIVAATSVVAQEPVLKVDAFSRSMDILYGDMLKTDRNGVYSAMVRVQLPVAGVKFEGNVLSSSYDVSEYLVYVTAGSKELGIKCPGVRPVRVRFGDYGIIRLEPKAVYVLNLHREGGMAGGSDKDVAGAVYKNIAAEANDCYVGHQYARARQLYNRALQPEFAAVYNIDDFRWIRRCDSIIAAQKAHRAITPELARAFRNLPYEDGMFFGSFSDSAMVLQYLYGHVTIITTAGQRTNLTDAFISFGRPEFSEGRLPLNLNGASCYVGRHGESVLGYRSADYNKLFLEEKLDFGSYRNGYAVVFDPGGDGKYGLIDEAGRTVLPVSGKYKHIVVLKTRVILYDRKKIYSCPLDGIWDGFDRKNIRELLSLDGYFVSHVTENYIILNNYKTEKCKIFLLSNYKVYETEAENVRPVDSTHVLCVLNKNYSVLDLTNEKMVALPGERPVQVVAQDLLFNGEKAFDLNGNTVFTLEEPVVTYSKYSEGYLPVSCGRDCRYIDRQGRTLPGSEFRLKPTAGDGLLHREMLAPLAFRDGFGVIIRGSRFGLVDTFGNTTFDFLEE